MKNIRKLNTIVFFVFLVMTQGCENILTEPAYSLLDSERLLSTAAGIESTLFLAYTKVANMDGNGSQHTNKREEMTTDILTHSGGGEHRNAIQLLMFTWDAGCCVESAFYWDSFWEGILNANIVLENIDGLEGASDEYKAMITAEARFVRAYAYYELWDQFGQVPLRTSTQDPLEQAKVSEQELVDFIASEFTAVADILPEPGSEPNYGRANRGAANGFLTLLYMNTKQWEKTAEVTLKIINSDYYQLYPDYNELFSLDNERNSEFIWVRPAITGDGGARNNMTATAFPWGFVKALDGGIAGRVDKGWTNYDSQYRLRDAFYFSFAENDERKLRILTKYIDKAGNTVDLIADYDDATRSMKFPPDDNATGLNHGNDIPKIRYAEILLARAEALNELDGPNQASVDLINEIRDRAGVDRVFLSDFETKEALRDHLLDERAWEFFYEAKRRRDLIRMDKFIENAHERGVTNAKPFHERFPIPQYAIDANPNLKQNPGY